MHKIEAEESSSSGTDLIFFILFGKSPSSNFKLLNTVDFLAFSISFSSSV